MQPAPRLNFDNSFARLPGQFHHRQQPDPLPNPYLVAVDVSAAALIDLDPATLAATDWAEIISGQRALPGADPLAMVYAGHQFGGYSPRLGDGRGLLLGEVCNRNGERIDLHLKGAGLTPFSRMGDGRAVLRSCIREYLAGIAMAGLGIPSTRALCVIGSDLPVRRERIEPGATLLRLAGSHIRFGHFEYFYHSGDHASLRQLLDYTLERHFPAALDSTSPPLTLLCDVIDRTARLIAEWQAVGFAHGVMNSDNMSIIGETLDYGPYGFQDHYRFDHVCNHSDHHGRYAFDQQPAIGWWNLRALALCFSEWIETEAIERALDQYQWRYLHHFERRMRAKLGLMTEQADDRQLMLDLLDLLHAQHVDYSRCFRALSSEENPQQARDLFAQPDAFDAWHRLYARRLQQEEIPAATRAMLMRQVNPKYTLRNYLAEQAIRQAEQGDFSLIDRLSRLLQQPHDEHPADEAWAGSPPEWGQRLQISCSS